MTFPGLTRKTSSGQGLMEMVNRIKSQIRLIVLLLMLILIYSLIPIVASAENNPGTPGITVTNAGIVNVVSPGQVFTHTMTVSIGPNDPATMVTVSVDGLDQSSNGTYILLDAENDNNPDTARPFVTVNTSSFQLQPGGSQDLVATINVPQNASLAGYFACITISSPPEVTNGSSVAFATSVNVPVYLTIKDSQLTQTGKITGITTGTITNGQPVAITTSFQNTGNTYFKIEGETTVSEAQGSSGSLVLADMPVTLTASSVLPGMSRDMEADYTPSGKLSPGTYMIDSKIMLSDGSVLDETTSSFTIKAPYVPPPALGTLNLGPMDGISNLQSTDGSISISFPAGAAAIPVNLALNNYTTAQLPVAPTGFTLTGNCFQVNGLTGLLAKNATVTVKYTEDDLSKANGNANQLVLMRWNAGTNHWVVDATKVNTKTSTLSVSDNSMGIWAVAVGAAPTSSGINWIVIGSIVAVVVIVAAIVTLFFMNRKKRQVKPAKR
jgi:hypothetical protein